MSDHYPLLSVEYLNCLSNYLKECKIQKINELAVWYNISAECLDWQVPGYTAELPQALWPTSPPTTWQIKTQGQPIAFGKTSFHIKKCECGSEKAKVPGHSNWCPLFEE